MGAGYHSIKQRNLTTGLPSGISARDNAVYFETPPASLTPITACSKGCISGAREKSQPFHSGFPGSWINTCAAGILGSFDADVISLSPILKCGKNARTLILTFVSGTASSDPIATV